MLTNLKIMEEKVFICACNSFEHQAIFWYDNSEDELYVQIHLETYRGFFKRLWYGIKYAFGHESRFGSWDEFLFRPDDKLRLFKFLNKKINGKT